MTIRMLRRYTQNASAAQLPILLNWPNVRAGLATRRWLKRFRQEHPHLPVIIVEDALSVNAPHLDDLREARAHYIIGVKPGDATISNTTTDMACRICPWC